MKPDVNPIRFLDMDMIKLTAGGYEAIICPGMGCNCVSLTHTATGARLLRTPPDGETFKKGANVFGTPLLFPPNRIKDGTFEFEGRKYELPINETGNHHHMHGFLSATAFGVVAMAADETTARVTCEYRATAEAPYSTFPHAFSIRYETCLDFEGLHQSVSVTNDSAETMPLGLGFHTTLRAPALKGADPLKQRLTLTAGKKWLYDERIIPTGETTADDALLGALTGEGVVPCEAPISIHCEQRGGMALLRDLDSRYATLYRVDDNAFRYWMVWNGSARDEFICPEPQTNMVDFVNRPFPPEVTGLIALPPGETHTVRTNLSFIKI